MPITDGLDQALVNAGLALLSADVGPPPLVVFDGIVPANTAVNAGYVLVYSSTEWPAAADGDALDGISGSPTARWICHCVGGSAAAARAVRQRVRTALLNKRPTIAGLSVGIIREEPGFAPPQRDETTGTPVMDAVVTYRLAATT